MKRIFAILITCVFLFGFTFAPGMFTHVVKAPEENISGETATGSINVSNLNELILAGQNNVSNDASLADSNRKALKLTANITLSENVTLNTAVSIDLNGNTLNLNDRVLTVRHTYAGNFLMTNGSVTRGTNGAGKIALRTPNANYSVDASFQDAIDFAGTLSAMAQAYVEDFITHNGYNGNYWGDIDLPVTFGVSGRYTYVSSDLSLIDNKGRVMISTADSTTDAAVPVNVTFTPESGTATTFTITPRIIGKANTSVWNTLFLPEVTAKFDAVHGLNATVTNSIYLPLEGYFGTASYTCAVSGTSYVTTGSGYAYIDVSAMITDAVANCTLIVTVNGIVTNYELTPTAPSATEDIPGKIIETFFGVTNTKSLSFVKLAPKTYTVYTLLIDNGDASRKAQLDNLGLVDVDFILGNNLNGTFSTSRNELTVVKDTDLSESVYMDMKMTIYDDENNSNYEVTRRIALIYKNIVTDTEANPTRFETHFAYYSQALRNVTYGQNDVDTTFELPAIRDNMIPFVAYRVTQNGAAYTVTAANGGIDVTFVGTDGNNYIPTYGANGLFSGFEGKTLQESMQLYVKGGAPFTNNPKWKFTVDSSKRNVRAGAVDVNLELEYQYTFTPATEQNPYWFIYTDSDSALTKITSPLNLLALVMYGTTAADFSFDNQFMYEAVKNEIASSYLYIPKKKLEASRDEFYLKALMYPDVNLTDSVDNGDVDSATGAEKDSVATLGITNYQWLEYLTRTRNLNLRGMHMTDAIVTNHLANLTQLTELDVSGVKEVGYNYNDANVYNGGWTTYPYSSMVSNITDTSLKVIGSLVQLVELNVSFCKITSFVNLAYLTSTLKTCYLQGNQTGGGSGSGDSLGSAGNGSAPFIHILAGRCKVYNLSNMTILVPDAGVQDAAANWVAMNSFIVPSVIPSTMKLTDVVAMLPVLKHVSFTILGLGYSTGTYTYTFDSEYSNTVLITYSAKSWSTEGVFYTRRLNFTRI